MHRDQVGHDAVCMGHKCLQAAWLTRLNWHTFTCFINMRLIMN